MRSRDLVRFIKARENARRAKEGSTHTPIDPIIAKYRFCNVHREDDYVTRWLRANWYLHLSDDPDVWFAAVVARLFNQPEALYDILPYVLPWKPEKVRKILHARKMQGKKNFNAAYIVSTNGVAMDKIDYIVGRVLGPLWADRKEFRGVPASLEVFYDMLTQYDGLGSFIAAQVIADLKYHEDWQKLPDWETFAASGPGSRRGLNRVYGYDPSSSYGEREWRCDLALLRAVVNKEFPELHAQDLQNCLCEFDKYERARLGEGTPKQLYKPREN